MNILLAAVNAKYIHSNPAIYSLRSACGHKKSVTLAEYTINHQQEKVLADIYERKPDVLAFSCYIWNISFIEQLAADLSRLRPDLPIWLGGPEVSCHCREVLQRMPGVKGIMRGEGEKTFAQLANHYTEHTPALTQIPGICFREGDTLYDNGEPLPVELDSLSFWGPEVLNDGAENRIIYYESGRGCPFSCSYCLSSLDKAVRFRSLELVKQEVLYFLEKKVPRVKFIDRTFNCDRKRALEIWEFIKNHHNGVTCFHFEVDGDLLDEASLALLETMPAGVVQLEIGVQTTNPRTLEEIRRKTDQEQLFYAVKRLTAKNHVHCHLDLIAGLPYEDYDSFRRSFDQVFALGPHQLQLGFLKVLKGTYMEEMAEAYQLKYKSAPPYEVLSTKWLSYEQIIRLKGVEEMTEIYANSNQFCLTLQALLGQAAPRSVPQSVQGRAPQFTSPFAFFEALADFYKQKGLAAVSHSRLRRYEILMAFYRTAVEERRDSLNGEPLAEEELKLLLALDLYARELCKSRPDWAPSLDRRKEDIRRFYQQETQEWRYLQAYHGFTAPQLSRMTHLEPLPEGGGVLFDYRSRDPVTGNVRMIWLPEL